MEVLAVFYSSVLIFVVSSIPAAVAFLLPVQIRRNLRAKFQIGLPGSYLGDFLMCLCFGPCSCCQVVRSMPVSNAQSPLCPCSNQTQISGWDWLADFRLNGIQWYNSSFSLQSNPPLNG